MSMPNFDLSKPTPETPKTADFPKLVFKRDNNEGKGYPVGNHNPSEVKSNQLHTNRATTNTTNIQQPAIVQRPIDLTPPPSPTHVIRRTMRQPTY